jgi:hypothetical protein
MMTMILHETWMWALLAVLAGVGSALGLATWLQERKMQLRRREIREEQVARAARLAQRWLENRLTGKTFGVKEAEEAGQYDDAAFYAGLRDD